MFLGMLFNRCGSGASIGQNIYATASSQANANVDLGNPPVQSWYDEVQWYNLNANSCSAPPGYSCGHYTQVFAL